MYSRLLSELITFSLPRSSLTIFFLNRVLTAPFQWVLFKDTKAGAQTQIRLAVDPALESVSGKYFRDCEEATLLFMPRNLSSVSKWLWQRSEELTKMTTFNSEDV